MSAECPQKMRYALTVYVAKLVKNGDKWVIDRSKEKKFTRYSTSKKILKASLNSWKSYNFGALYREVCDDITLSMDGEEHWCIMIPKKWTGNGDRWLIKYRVEECKQYA